MIGPPPGAAGPPMTSPLGAGGAPPSPPAPPPNPLSQAPPKPVVYKNPLLRVPESRRHQLERVAILVDGWIDRQVEILTEWFAPGDRPPFAIPLTDEEKLQRAHNVKWVEGQVAEIQRTGSPEEVRQFLDDLMARAEKQNG